MNNIEIFKLAIKQKNNSFLHRDERKNITNKELYLSIINLRIEVIKCGLELLVKLGNKYNCIIIYVADGGICFRNELKGRGIEAFIYWSDGIFQLGVGVNINVSKIDLQSDALIYTMSASSTDSAAACFKAGIRRMKYYKKENESKKAIACLLGEGFTLDSDIVCTVVKFIGLLNTNSSIYSGRASAIDIDCEAILFIINEEVGCENKNIEFNGNKVRVVVYDDLMTDIYAGKWVGVTEAVQIAECKSQKEREGLKIKEGNTKNIDGLYKALASKKVIEDTKHEVTSKKRITRAIKYSVNLINLMKKSGINDIDVKSVSNSIAFLKGIVIHDNDHFLSMSLLNDHGINFEYCVDGVTDISKINTSVFDNYIRITVSGDDYSDSIELSNIEDAIKSFNTQVNKFNFIKSLAKQNNDLGEITEDVDFD
ncbi:MAG: hypothetical protein QM504_08460 [Pseudomonadota bacterium]